MKYSMLYAILNFIYKENNIMNGYMISIILFYIKYKPFKVGL